MILAAGLGTRLGEIGRSTPKILLDVQGEPLLTRHLRYLEREGVQRVVVNAHHLADQVKRCADAYRGPLELVVVEEPTLLGTAGGVRNALGHLLGTPFVVLYGDVVVDQALPPIVRTHRRARAAATLTVYPAASTVGKGVVKVDAEGRISGFVEKQAGRSGPGLVNAGLYLVESDLLAPLPPGESLDFGHDVFPAAVARGERIFSFLLPEPVIDIGTPAALALARTSGAHSDAETAPAASLRGVP